MFFGFPLGIFLLSLKLKPADNGNAAQKNETAETGTQTTSPKVFSDSPLLSAIRKNLRRGRLLSIVGSAVSLNKLISLVKQIASPFHFSFDNLSTLGWLVAGLTILASGIARIRLSRRQRLYLGAVGDKKSIFFSDLASAAGISGKRVANDLQKMLSDGTLPMGYIDRAGGRLVLTDKGYERTGPKTEEPAARVVQEATQEDKDRAVLLQIRAVNDAIPNGEMTGKINRIEEITGKILAFSRSHPQKAGELRKFLDYYLPTTLKILNAYAQMDAQGVESENISTVKTRIEGMMD